MSKIDLKAVGKTVLNVFGIAATGLLVTQMVKNEEYVSEPSISYGVTYSDAVEAIMESDMWSSDKEQAVTYLNRRETADYYKAIINIVNGDMWSSDKLKLIKNLG